jgi:OmpA-OmpF porin, OOP family
MRSSRLSLSLLMALGGWMVLPIHAQPAAAAQAVVLSGAVPDEATHQAILARAREVYGERVLDRLSVGHLVAPANWAQYVQKLITDDLKTVSKGQLSIAGTAVGLTGEVESEAQRQRVVGLMSASLNPTYVFHDELRVVSLGQGTLDSAMANRTIAFQTGNAILLPEGRNTLDQLLPVLQQFKGRRFQVIGHTDAQGSAPQNQALSLARAQSVKAYLVAKGSSEAGIDVSGEGADRPIASNETAEGRARNRRIEFRLAP